MSAAMFWFHRRAAFPGITEVALRLYATPVSSTTSERAFSMVNRTLASDGSRMTSSNLENVLVAKSTIGSGVVSRTTRKKIDSDVIDSQIDEGNYAVVSE